MWLKTDQRRVLVTGATSFLGFRVVAALLEQDWQVTVILQQDQTDKLASLGDRVKVVYGDVWNRASLKGLSRGYQAVAHLVGSAKADPKRGLTHQQINLVSARNVIGMAIGDGVPTCLLLSAAALPWTAPAEYLRSKREAEEYLVNSGLNGVIIRAPLLYAPGHPSLLSMMAVLGVLPPSRWVVGRYMPLAVDTAARGIAAALQEGVGQVLYANDLRRLARQFAPRGRLLLRPAMVPARPDDLENVPFGWLPPPTRRRR